MQTGSPTDIQYVLDRDGHPTAVVVPIDLWREIASELETNHLLGSETMRRRLLAARGRSGGMLLEEVLEELDSIRAFDEAKAEIEDEAIPFEQAVEEIERSRR